MTNTISRFYANARKRILRNTDEVEGVQPVSIVRKRDGVLYTNTYGTVLWLRNDELRAARVAVKRGAALLDKRLPGWESILQLDGLQLSSCELCVCGQLAYATKTPEFKSIFNRKIRQGLGENPFSSMLEFLGIYDANDDLTSDFDASHFGFDAEYDRRTLTSFSYEALEVEWHRLVSRRLRTGKVSGS